jgi:uncharacterized protein (DUF1499 family)
MTETPANSRLVNYLGRAAIACLAAVPLSVLAVRLGLDVSIGLPIFALSGVAGLVVIVLLVVVSLLPRYRAERTRALMWTLPAIPPVLLITAVLSTAGQYPPIHDITTDPRDPPIFDAGSYYRGEDANSIAIKPEVIETQQRFYPDLSTITTDMPPEQAFARATDVAESMGWKIYNSDPTNGRIEAETRSFWFGFTDDIVIRIGRGEDGGTEVDLRSVSRVGRSDLGANAARIRAFSERY